MPYENDSTTRRRRIPSGAARPAATTLLSLALVLSLGGGAAAVACATAARTATPRTTAGCAAAPYRAFDFWLGSWEVHGRGGRVVGASRITPAVGGCAIEERWRVAAGLGGRSINAYDRRDGRWHQLWVDRGANVLRLAGAPATDGAMVMFDARAAGDASPPHDRITWTPLDSGRVRQQWDTATVGGSDTTSWRASFAGVYAPRRDSVVLQPPPVTTAAAATPPASPAVAPCKAASGPYRALDFLVGDWEVHVGRRDGPVAGRRTVVKDLNDCLTVGADFDAAGTYRGIAYAAYDARTARWYRESVDDEGRRLVLVGDAPPEPGAPLGMYELREASPPSVSLDPVARVLWRALPGGAVSERWERSADGGATWRFARELVLTPR